MRFTSIPLSAAALAAGLVFCPSLSALTINPTWDSSITSDTNATAIESAINSAINIYQTTFSNPVTVDITFKEVTTGLGTSSVSYDTETYSAFYTALNANLTGTNASANQRTAATNLPAMAPSSVFNSLPLQMTVSLARTLGLDTSTPSPSDNEIDLNIGSMNLTRPGTNANNYDLESTAEHEIDEVLGWSSGLNNNGTTPATYFTPQDLYHFTSTGFRTFIYANDNAYFSINGGATTLSRFNQNVLPNTGGDYGDWSPENGAAQVQDAFGTPGTNAYQDINSTGDTEVTALSVIGYNLTAVPEPAPTALVMGSLAMLLAFFYRRRRQRLAA